MSDEIQIRPTRPDHPQVVALLDELDAYLCTLYAPDDNHILDVQALLAPEVHFVAAWQADRVLGCAAVRRMAGEPATGGQAYGEIKRMMVAPAARGRQLGSRLLAALEQHLRGIGLPLALLETGCDQHEAVRLYERAGYSRCGPFGGYPDNGLSLFYAKAVAS
jgi:putative acetyltransferase